MAREGTSTIVENKEEKDTIKSYEGFGWELQNAQSLENGNVKLVFTRDKQLPNYSRLVSLEEQYYKIKLHKKNTLFGNRLWGFRLYLMDNHMLHRRRSCFFFINTSCWYFRNYLGKPSNHHSFIILL